MLPDVVKMQVAVLSICKVLFGVIKMIKMHLKGCVIFNIEAYVRMQTENHSVACEMAKWPQRFVIWRVQ